MAVETFKAADVEKKERPAPTSKRAPQLFWSSYNEVILPKPREELRGIGVDERGFRDAFAARNEFYQACYNEREIVSVGFEEQPTFPIRRNKRGEQKLIAFKMFEIKCHVNDRSIAN